MANGAKKDDGWYERTKKELKDYMAWRKKDAARRKAEEQAKADAAAAAKQKAAEAKPSGDTSGMMGPGGYGGRRGAERQKQQIERESQGLSPTAFQSSNRGQNGIASASERRARDKRLKNAVV